MLGEEEKINLIGMSLKARELAYAPYSGFSVGAALLAHDGTVFLGGNIENASYGATNCAERTAFFKAVSEGYRNFKAIAIAGGRTGEAPADHAYPCGICRQVMQEFCGGDFEIFVVKNEQDFLKFRLADLLPCGFGGEQIQ